MRLTLDVPLVGPQAASIALAAKRALHDSARRILIIDTEAHRAGGTHSLIKNSV
jgi:acetoin utilization deacetylase AcuC-like enzyme